MRHILWFDPTTEFHTYSFLWNDHQIVFGWVVHVLGLKCFITWELGKTKLGTNGKIDDQLETGSQEVNATEQSNRASKVAEAIIVKLRDALEKKSNEYNETESKLNSALEEVKTLPMRAMMTLVQNCIWVLADKVGYISRQRSEFQEPSARAEAAEAHLLKELEGSNELLPSGNYVRALRTVFLPATQCSNFWPIPQLETVYSVMGLTLLKVGIPCLLLLLSIHVDHAMSSNLYFMRRCSVAANYTDGDEFLLNMVDVFSTSRNEAPPTGFSNTTAGQGTEEVYGLIQCRGDVGKEECKSCISRSTIEVVK
ncbi:putative cysteine-rich repeat secretory protein 5 [Nymphaea thermarum]|nr:putative cysteine-rich repeat secretory protein 5 [Nymphaea thermarum]